MCDFVCAIHSEIESRSAGGTPVVRSLQKKLWVI